MSRRTLPLRERFGGAALITGASSGIGAAFARALAARGMDLVLVARREDKLQSLAAEVERNHGVRAVVQACDLVSEGAVEQVLDAVDAAKLEVGLLINNAGFGGHGPFAEQDPARSVTMVTLNCAVPVALTLACLPQMRERGYGGVIFVASTAAYQPTPYLAVYGATKAFDLMLAEALWAELRAEGIEVLGLSPGSTATEFFDVAGEGDFPTQGTMATPEAVVATALSALGRKPSVVHGWLNKLTSWVIRFVPRKLVAIMARRACAPKTTTKSLPAPEPARTLDGPHA